MHGHPARPGFSLIEALVVLAISGMALAIIFSIGTKAGDSGFALGRRAMAASDTDMNIGDLRVLMRSAALRPRRTFKTDVDRPFVGLANRLETDVVMERATQCAPQGWAGLLTLSIESRGAEHALVCRAGDRSIRLITTRGPLPNFSYSTDRQNWSAAFSNVPDRQAVLSELRPEVVWIRFQSPRSIDVIERATSGQPGLWLRPEDDF